MDDRYNVCMLCYSKASAAGERVPALADVKVERSNARPLFFFIGATLLVLAAVAGLLAFFSAASPASTSTNTSNAAASPDHEPDTNPSTTPVISQTSEQKSTKTENNAAFTHQYTDLQPPCNRSSGDRIKLVNNPDARDVSYDALCVFVSQDKTDSEPYIDDQRKCADFAETVHNNAEKYGIRSAWVGILFENREAGHAINAFQTTDRGLVYIDCTGTKRYEACAGADHIAYIEKGREYGCIDINFAGSFDYSFYSTYQQSVNDYQSKLTRYNSDVEAYNRALGGRTSLAEPEYSKFKSWAQRLEQQKSALKELSDKIGRCFVIESIGIVKTVDLYW